MIQFSVVIPVYNSKDSLTELFNRTKAVFSSAGYNFEVIFVDDGSTDKSWDVLKEIKVNNPDYAKIIRLNKNFGQHNAIMCGFTFATGEKVITIDDDLQNPPEEIIKLIDTNRDNGSDVTYGIYTKKQHNFARNIMSKGVAKSSKIFMKGNDKGSSFRIIDGSIIKKILNHNITFIFIDEILQWYTNKISFVDVEHHKREFNKSGYSKRKLFQIASNLLYYYTNIPLKLMVYGGMIISFISFALAIKYFLQKLFYDVPAGYTSIIVAILFSTGIIVFSLGIIGGYLSRIQLVQNKKPPFYIEEVI